MKLVSIVKRGRNSDIIYTLMRNISLNITAAGCNVVALERSGFTCWAYRLGLWAHLLGIADAGTCIADAGTCVADAGMHS